MSFPWLNVIANQPALVNIFFAEDKTVHILAAAKQSVEYLAISIQKRLPLRFAHVQSIHGRQVVGSGKRPATHRLKKPDDVRHAFFSLGSRWNFDDATIR
jgi:hypothetical protein